MIGTTGKWLASARQSVAPDFAPAKHFNTLVERTEMRVVLRIGDIEDLFSEPPNTDEGRRQRLQVLGLYYLPLGHGPLAKVNRHPLQEQAWKVCWPHVKSNVFGVRRDSDADRIIQEALAKRVVGRAWAPFRELKGMEGGLPLAPSDPSHPTRANFAKIRVPGGYTYMDGGGAISSHLPSSLYYCGNYKLGRSEVWSAEEAVLGGNPVLGKIPIVATVERRTEEGWTPAGKGIAVHFELVRPYDLPSFVGSVACGRQYSRPPYKAAPVAPGQGAVVAAMEGQHPDPSDPQGANCTVACGGKRGSGTIQGQVLLTASTPGFNVPYPNRPLPHPPFDGARPSSQSPRAVWASTNEKGEAGVLFAPSSKGGDRYRFRVFVGPPTLPGNGTGPDAVAVETGTLVVWRNIRISRYVRQESPEGSVAPILMQDVAPLNIASPQHYQNGAMLSSQLVVAGPAQYSYVGMAPFDLSDPQPGSAPVDGVLRQFARAFCEVEPDRGAGTPQPLSQEEWEKAVRFAVKEGKKFIRKWRQNTDVDKLFCMDLIPKSITVTNAVCHLPMRTPAAYNQAVGRRAFSTAQDTKPIDDLFFSCMSNAFLWSLSEGGALPGLTLVQGGFGATWQLFGLIERNLGLATPFRGAFIWGGKEADDPPPTGYPCGRTGTAVHEMGHCLFRLHAPRLGVPLQKQIDDEGIDPQKHDSLAQSVCLMSYAEDRTVFCGRCLLALRGWKI